MAMQVRYSGSFLSRAGVVWRADILQHNDELYEEVGELTFEADEAIVIKYPETSKEDVVCGSSATIQIESPGDRTYEDLYTIAPGEIRLDVYRNGALYWSGTLDPEFYEEPYEKASHYVVSLTFSDFGPLDRLNYERRGVVTIEDVVSYALTASGINFGYIDKDLISTSLMPNGSPISLTDIKVRSDNFYDEDGEALSIKEVLEGVLQPLGLRMVQRSGNVYVYDLNGLYAHAGSVDAIWSADRSTMGVDVVYNNAKITWSPYAQSGNLTPQECWVKGVNKNLTNLNSLKPLEYKGSDYYSYHYSTEIEELPDDTDCGFTIYLNKEGKNAEIPANSEARFFKIVPQHDGSEDEGIAIYVGTIAWKKEAVSGGWHTSVSMGGVGVRPKTLAGTLASTGGVLFKSQSVWLPPVDDFRDLLVRVGLEVLIDPRFNPFEQAANLLTGVKQKDYQRQWKEKGNFVYIPVTIKYQPDGSDEVYCWDNRSVVSRSVKTPIRTLDRTLGEWVKYDQTKDETPNAWGYLCYYKPTDRIKDSGVAQGWATNRQAINPHSKPLTTLLEKIDSGQYIWYPKPAIGGRLWMEIRAGGWMIGNGVDDLSYTQIQDPYKLWNTGDDKKTSWILAKLPTMEIVNNTQFEQEISTDDVVYSASLNLSAKDPIEIDTICGTTKEGVPTARGAYFNAETGEQVKELTRAGRTSQVEELLIGTLYSQYARRHTKLSGEIELHANGLVTYTEQNQRGLKFILAGETQNLITDVTEATLIELSLDEYDKKDNGEETI